MIEPSLSDEPDASNEHERFVHEYVNDAVGAWFGGGPPPGPATVLGWKTTASETSSSGSLMPSPDSSVQARLPSAFSVSYRPDTPV